MNALILAIGGGGDIASAAMIAKALHRLGINYVLGSIAWERYVYDETPGPIKLSDIHHVVERGDHHVLVDEKSYALRKDKVVVFQAVKVAKMLGEPVYVVDLYDGVRGYVSALMDIIRKRNIDLVIGVDVGGDSLATGCEDSLWSPLADWLGLASLAIVKGVVAVHSPGSDGELDFKYILDRIDYYARKGGLIGVRAMCDLDAKLLGKILENVDSEASRIPLLAYRGERGKVVVRSGSRIVTLNMINTFTFFLDARLVSDDIPPVKELYSTASLEDARKVLNSYGIYTELDLEEDIEKSGLKASELTGEVLLDIRRSGVIRVREAAIFKEYCS